MYRLKLASLTLFILLLVLYLHVNGIYSGWYNTFFFFDVIVHFLGGVGIALSAFFVFKHLKYIILTTIICAIIWELFEIHYDIAGWPLWTLSYYIDRIKDLSMGTLGAITVCLIIINRKPNEH